MTSNMLLIFYIFSIALLYQVEAGGNCHVTNLYIPVGYNYVFRSPNFPNPYPIRDSCYWTAFSSIGAKFHLSCSLDINDLSNGILCEFDRLFISPSGDPQLNDAAYYCGVGSLSFTTDSNQFSAYFESLYYAYHLYKGFTCKLTPFIHGNIETTPFIPEPTTSPISQCGKRKTQRIVNGNETELHEHPWQVSIVQKHNKEHFCGGSIINEKWILTAAHCLSVSSADILIVIGEHNKNIETETDKTDIFEVKRIIINENYNQDTVEHDIALIELFSEITFSDYVSPVCLPYKFIEENYHGKTGIVSGWGLQSFNGQDTDVLLDVELPIYSTAECRKINVELADKIKDQMICTYRPGYDACQGDSGGGLVYDEDFTSYIIGIVSWGINCAQVGYPGVYTDVRKYLEWIENQSGYIQI